MIMMKDVSVLLLVEHEGMMLAAADFFFRLGSRRLLLCERISHESGKPDERLNKESCFETD